MNADHVRACHGTERTVVESRDPGHERAVIEAKDELRAHLDAAAAADDDPRDVRGVATQGHEIDERDGALGGVEVGLQNERMLTIAPRDLRLGIAGSDLPAAVLRS